MPIEFPCPNGHKLKVDEASSGKKVRCPVCKAVAIIPRRRPKELDEDAILGILGPHQAKPVPAGESPESSPGPADDVELFGPPKKPCPKCHREILGETHICPHCHTYVANIDDF
jgi:hypothetical protein